MTSVPLVDEEGLLITHPLTTTTNSPFIFHHHNTNTIYRLPYNDVCPDCRLDAQDVTHLFNCPARPTGLTTRALWTDAREVAHFLASHPAFDGIAPPKTPPPRRRRRRGRPPSTSSARSTLFSPLSIPSSLSLSSSFSLSLSSSSLSSLLASDA